MPVKEKIGTADNPMFILPGAGEALPSLSSKSMDSLCCSAGTRTWSMFFCMQPRLAPRRGERLSNRPGELGNRLVAELLTWNMDQGPWKMRKAGPGQIRQSDHFGAHIAFLLYAYIRG